MTAYVVWGLSLARDAGVEIKAGRSAPRRQLSGRTSGRRRRQSRHAGLDAARVFGLSCLPHKHNSAARKIQRQSARIIFGTTAMQLNAYTRALLALARTQPGQCRPRKNPHRKSRQRRETRRPPGHFGSDYRDANAPTQLSPQSSAPRIGARMAFIGAGRTAASRPPRLPCARCWRLIRTNTTRRTRLQLAHQKPPRRAMEQHARHRHHRAGDE